MLKILSIDGGGIRGLIPALLLQKIEKEVDKPISEIFDLISGTSTGGILACGLCKPDHKNEPEFSARDLTKIYSKRGNEIFSRSLWQIQRSGAGIFDEKYNVKNLENILQEYFGSVPLNESITRLMVTSYDIQGRCPVFLKSWDQRTSDIEMRIASRATSAAPTYFEPVQVAVDGSTRSLVDGGVFVNNPSLSAFAEAKRVFGKEDDILIVSLGTGEAVRAIPYNDAKNWGKAEWAIPILSIIFDGVADAVDYQMDHLIGEENYYRFNISLDSANDDMDDATARNITALTNEAKRLMRVQKIRLSELIERLKG